jgi:hypothetical protein
MLLPELTKQIASGIGWLATSLVGITAILSAAGFLVIRSHQDLLGITGLVPILPETWPIEGARFIYNSLFYLVAGLLSNHWTFLLILISYLLFVVTTDEKLSAKTIPIMRNFLVKILIAVLLLGGLSATLYVLLKYEAVSYLLVDPVFVITEQSMTNLRSENIPDNVLDRLNSIKGSILVGRREFLNTLKERIGDEQIAKFKSSILKHSIDKSIEYRRNKYGIIYLRSKYSILESSILLISVCLKFLLPSLDINITAHRAAKEIIGFIHHEKSLEHSINSVWISLLCLILWFFFFVTLILLPMNYGKLVKAGTHLRRDTMCHKGFRLLKPWPPVTGIPGVFE